MLGCGLAMARGTELPAGLDDPLQWHILRGPLWHAVYLISRSYTNFCTFLCRKCDVGYYVINHDDD